MDLGPQKSPNSISRIEAQQKFIEKQLKENKMIKILKEGKVPYQTFTGSCHNCQSKLEADVKEVKDIKNSSVDFREEYYEFGTITCPVCQKSLTVYASK